MLELYNFPPSTCSLKVRICLAEKNLDWLDHRMESRNGDHLKPEYLKLNPNGVVPSVIHDGNVIIDSSVIMEYLDEVFPHVRLSPEPPLGRAHMRKWLRYFEEVQTQEVRYPSDRQFQEVVEGGIRSGRKRPAVAQNLLQAHGPERVQR